MKKGIDRIDRGLGICIKSSQPVNGGKIKMEGGGGWGGGCGLIQQHSVKSAQPGPVLSYITQIQSEPGQKDRTHTCSDMYALAHAGADTHTHAPGRQSRSHANTHALIQRRIQTQICT